jgi:dCTP deaminase
MSIKSDKWIRRMAATGMIEPFEPGQVRERDGKRIVSYGTSSYGYDIRCAECGSTRRCARARTSWAG